MSCYVPRLRVDLRQWCEWTGRDWSKVRAVTGTAFRMCGPHENIYTMAANAVLRLIIDNDIDPVRVGFLALGTESSTDNAVGAITVLGMVDRELRRRGAVSFSRDMEVPEFKHACLGGMYALTGAARYVQCSPRGRQAIVVASDIAEYERGSSGEQTQGAGAVAMLVERSPALLALDLSGAARSCADRGPDFRKPTARHRDPRYAGRTRRPSDFPVFSGNYSTSAYTDAMSSAVDALWSHLDGEPLEWLNGLGQIFMHRPFRHMPVRAASVLYARALASSPGAQGELEAICAASGISPADLHRERDLQTDLYAAVLAGDRAPDPHPATTALASHLRKQPSFSAFAAGKMNWGGEQCDELGNLYSASLPVGLAAGLEAAAHADLDITGKPLLAAGYGSGDAALVLPCTAVPGWRSAASRIGLARAARNPVDLNQCQYEQLHDFGRIPGLQMQPLQEFVIERSGTEYSREFQDLAVHYYAYEY